MLGKADVIAFVPTRDPQRARAFYEGVLGLEFVGEDLFAKVFKANGVMVRVVNVSTVEDFRPHPFTVLGWRVESAEGTVRALGEKGVTFERYAGMQMDEMGIWRSPSGAKVAWFKDPDGNILSVTEG
ncbi:MAG TPA: VOC family protein [Phycisphaerae bacterium]|nr:VOC family protein [Phycisphaerae bacterium]